MVVFEHYMKKCKFSSVGTEKGQAWTYQKQRTRGVMYRDMLRKRTGMSQIPRNLITPSYHLA